jgi:hypothetical protein
LNRYSASGIDQIIILDPGLREHGGHHPAFILSMLNCEVFKNDLIALTVYANKEFDESGLFDAISNSKKSDLIPFFDIDYYHHFYASATHLELPSFIRQLTLQYLAAFTQTAVNLPEQNNCSQVYFFHTIGWEHASALADALYLFEKQTGQHIRVVVLLMFSPYRHCVESTYDHSVYLKFKIAFKRLASFVSISFFACDHETSKAYEHILGKKIDICPLPFITHKHYLRAQEKTTTARQIILYLGDTKATKGFLALPYILEQIVKLGKNEDVSYLIQYSLTNKSEEFLAVDKILKKFAALHPNIDVYEVFWPEQQLHETLASCYAIVFNYDSSVYMYQSSGVLWLAAYYNLKMFFLSNNWLTREAARLKSKYTLCDAKKFNECLKKLSHGDINKPVPYANISPQITDEYHAKLFSDFAEWLSSILDAN